MTGLIDQIFNNKKKKLVTFVTGGDPDFETSNEIIKNLILNEVDLIEIGMPFSDPMADGPTIQLSSERAIRNGMNINDVFKLVSNAKKINNELPIILMGYYNVIFHYGIKKFVKKCASFDVNGLIIVDLQPEEDEELYNELEKYKIHLIRLITPTTNENRLKLILKKASGFLYYVSIMGTTGQKSANINELKKSLQTIRSYTNLPIVPGFGIKNANDVKKICEFADGAVVGSSIIKIVEENLNDKVLMIKEINNFVKELKRGTIV